MGSKRVTEMYLQDGWLDGVVSFWSNCPRDRDGMPVYTEDDHEFIAVLVGEIQVEMQNSRRAEVNAMEVEDTRERKGEVPKEKLAECICGTETVFEA